MTTATGGALAAPPPPARRTHGFAPTIDLTVTHDALTVIHHRDPRPRRLLAGLAAGAAALAVAIAGGSVVVDRHSGPLTAGLSGVHAAGGQHVRDQGTRRTLRHPPRRRARAPRPRRCSACRRSPVCVEPGVVVIDSPAGLSERRGRRHRHGAEPHRRDPHQQPRDRRGDLHHRDGVRQPAALRGARRRHRRQRRTSRSCSSPAPAGSPPFRSATPTPSRPASRSSASATPAAPGRSAIVTGNVTDTDRSITASDQSGASSENLSGMIEVQAPIMAGDSGGPLASRYGKVIGMDTAASAASEHGGRPTYGFAIPINRALAIAARLERERRHAVARAAATSASRSRPSTRRRTPAAPRSSPPTPTPPPPAPASSPATSSRRSTGEPVTSADGLTSDAGPAPSPGELVTVGWTDEFGESHTAEVTLDSGPAD